MNVLSLHETDIPAVSDLIKAQSFDPKTGIYECDEGAALLFEILPLVGMDDSGIEALRSCVLELQLEDGVFSVLNWSTLHIDPQLDKWTNDYKFDPAGFATHRTKILKTMSVGQGAYHWRPRHFKVFLSIMLPAQSGISSHDRLTKARIRLEQVFMQMGTQCRIVIPQALLQIYKSLLFPQLTTKPPKANWSRFEPINEQVRAPGENFCVDFSGITWNNDMQARSFVSRQFPDEWAPGAASSLLGDVFNTHLLCPFPYLQTVTITGAEMSKDVAGMRAARTEAKAKTVLRHLLPHLTAESSDWQTVTKELDEGAILARVLVHTVLYAPKEEMEQAESALRNLYQQRGFSFDAENGLHLPVLQACLPLGCDKKSVSVMKKLSRWRTVLMRNALTLLPLFGEWRGNASQLPAMLMLAGRRGELAGWTAFASQTNYNCSIVGQSGAGKSVLMQEMMAGLLAIGGAVVVIDDGLSFRNSCALLEGTHINFGETGLEINPFAAIDAHVATKDGDFAEAVISMLVAFCASLAHPGGEVTDLERAILTDATQSVWQKHKNNGRITDIVDHLKLREEETAKELVLLLSPFARGGAYAVAFDAGCSVDLQANLTVFEMSAVRDKQEIQAASMILLIFMATQKMYHSSREQPVAIIIDEAWAMLGGASSEFIDAVARRARKYNGSLICATQSVADFFLNRSAEAAWANSDWTLLMRQKDSSIDALRDEKRIRLDATLERALRSLDSSSSFYSELVLIGTTGWDVCRLVLDQISLAAYSSTAEDVAEIEKLITSGMGRPQAIFTFANKRQQRSA